MVGRVVIETLGRNAPFLKRERDASIFLQWIPRLQSFFDLVGEDSSIPGSLEHLLSEESGGRVVAVSVGRSAYKHRSDDQRASDSNCPNNIVEDAIMTPFLKSFIECFGKAIICSDREILLNAIVSIRLE